MPTSSSNRLPPLAAKPRPIVVQSVRSASGHAVASTAKQAGPKPRYTPLAKSEADAT
jgi:hypothetical protein